MKYPLRYSIIPLFTSLFILASCSEKLESDDGDNGVVMAEPSQLYEEVKPKKPAQKVATKESDNPEMNKLREKFQPGSWEYEVLEFIESEEMTATFNLDKVPYEGEELPAEAAIQLENLAEIASSFPYINIEIQAHTTAADNGAGRVAKKTTSKARALWVATKLSLKGVENSRLSSTGMADESLLDGFDPEDKAHKRIMAVLSKSKDF